MRNKPHAHTPEVGRAGPAWLPPQASIVPEVGRAVYSPGSGTGGACFAATSSLYSLSPRTLLVYQALIY